VRTFEREAFALKVGDRGTKNYLPGQGFIHQQEGCSIRSAAVGGLIQRDHSRSDQSRLGRSAQPMSLLGQKRRCDLAPATSAPARQDRIDLCQTKKSVLALSGEPSLRSHLSVG